MASGVLSFWSGSTVLAGGRAALTAALCVVLTVGPAVAETSGMEAAAAKPAPMAPTAKLTEQQKTLHALNRLTFGPRPGDAAAVQKMGLEVWFERQLKPQSIDDSALDSMMAKFPAMKLSSSELAKKFPNALMLKQIAERGDELPSGPAEHAIYAAAMANYEAKRGADVVDAVAAKKASKANARQQQASGSVAGEMGGDDMAGGENMSAPAGTIAANAGGKGNGKRADRKDRREEFQGNGAELMVLPPDQRMAKILAMSGPQLLAMRPALGARGMYTLMAGMSAEQKEVLAAVFTGPVQVVGSETLQVRLLRDVYSERQLEAVMTDFWLNHFSIYVRKNQNEPYLLNSYEKDTIHPRALGKFEDLLVATAHSPAMLMYLDNWQSVGPDSPVAQRGKKFSQMTPNSLTAQLMPKGINENYAREIIELHTIGVQCEVSADHMAKQLDPSCGAGYTQADVTNLAKVLTGWTIDRPYRGGQGFIFDERRHAAGNKQVLGKTISEGGEREGMQVLHMLATSPATAAFISHKLAVRFVSDNPPKTLEDRMAATFLKTNGDIKEVLRTMFHAPEFWTPTVYRAKVKTPIEFVASALRASDATINNAVPLVQAMDRLGMPLYGMQTPNGYPWVAEPWVSTTALVSRMNFALVLSSNLLPGTRTDFPALLGDSAAAKDAAPSAANEQKLEMLLLGQAAAAKTRATVLEQGAKPGQAQEAQKNFALGAADGVDMLSGGGQGKGRRNIGGASMTDMAARSGTDGPNQTMAGLLLGSPEFQRR